MFPRLRSVFRYAGLLLLVLVSAIMIIQLGISSSFALERIILPMEAYDGEVRNRDDPYTKRVMRTTTPVTIAHKTTHDSTLRTTTRSFQTTSEPKPTYIVGTRSFGYRINPANLCADQEVLIITYIHSAPINFKRRQAIRQSWGSQAVLKPNKIKVVFVFGLVPQESVMNLVEMEAERFSDVLQGEFLDTYRNLTYKAVVSMGWVSTFCPHAKFVLKTDDDILVNFYAFLDFIKNSLGKTYGPSRLLLCHRWIGMPVIRDKESKWYVSKEDRASDTFTTYCSGSAFFMTADVVSGMYKTTPFFWVDDYYVTGILIGKMNPQGL